MSRGLVLLLWHPEDESRSFSLLSPPPSSPEFPRSCREDSWTQMVSATCSIWDGPGEEKLQRKTFQQCATVRCKYRMMQNTLTISILMANINCVHHNLSQGPAGDILQRDGFFFKWILTTSTVNMETIAKVKSNEHKLTKKKPIASGLNTKYCLGCD